MGDDELDSSAANQDLNNSPFPSSHSNQKKASGCNGMMDRSPVIKKMTFREKQLQSNKEIKLEPIVQ